MALNAKQRENCVKSLCRDLIEPESEKTLISRFLLCPTQFWYFCMQVAVNPWTSSESFALLRSARFSAQLCSVIPESPLQVWVGELRDWSFWTEPGYYKIEPSLYNYMYIVYMIIYIYAYLYIYTLKVLDQTKFSLSERLNFGENTWPLAFWKVFATQVASQNHWNRATGSDHLRVEDFVFWSMMAQQAWGLSLGNTITTPLPCWECPCCHPTAMDYLINNPLDL